MASLARLTNVVQQALASGQYVGAIWLEGSPFVEETSYWLNLLIDTPVPFVGNASQRAHGAVSNDGDRNIIDAVDYIVSRIWADSSGRDSVGVVVIQDELLFTAREVQKADARPGGYVATGGHGGIVGTMGQPGPPALTFQPVKRHTHTSEVNLSRLPACVEGVRLDNGRLVRVTVPIKDAQGALLWLTGSLNGASAAEMRPLLLLMVLVVPLALWAGQALGGLQLGDDAATAVGVRVERSRLTLILIGVAMVAYQMSRVSWDAPATRSIDVSRSGVSIKTTYPGILVIAIGAITVLTGVVMAP